MEPKNEMANWENLLIQDIRLAGYGTLSEDIIPIEYNKNSLGYRSQEFENKAELLFIGDSFTRGDGLPIENVYTSILANKLGLSFSSLAVGGDSMAGQIAKCFFYFRKYGNPKYIVALFPMNRFSYPYLPEEMQNSESNSKQAKMFNSPGEDSSYTLSTDIYSYDVARYAKAPYAAEEIISSKLAFYHDRIMLDALEQYCETNGINFVWSIWNQKYQTSLYYQIEDKYPGYHKNYCWIDANLWVRQGDIVSPLNKEVGCHLDLSDHLLFNVAADRVKNNGRGAHNGFHWHMHAAEDIYRHISEKAQN
jgi:hypothetical protein